MCGQGWKTGLEDLPVKPAIRTTFIDLIRERLPGKAFKLIYSATEWTHSAKRFHKLCDGKGPTLCLIRMDTVGIIGGYTSTSWRSPATPRHVACEDAFLFTMSGVFGQPRLYPIVPKEAAHAMWCDAEAGPCFGVGAIQVCYRGRSCVAPVMAADETFNVDLDRPNALFGPICRINEVFVYQEVCL